jgi:hypothetical protein
MSRLPTPPFTPEAAAELHNRLVVQIVSTIFEEPIAAGGSMSDVMVLREGVMVGVIVGSFQLGSDAKMLDAIISQARARLARIRLADVAPQGRG